MLKDLITGLLADVGEPEPIDSRMLADRLARKGLDSLGRKPAADFGADDEVASTAAPAPRQQKKVEEFGDDDLPATGPMPKARPPEAPPRAAAQPSPTPTTPTAEFPDVQPLDDAPFRSGGRVIDKLASPTTGMLSGDQAYDAGKARVADAEKAVADATIARDASKQAYGDLLAAAPLTGGAEDVVAKRAALERSGLGAAEQRLKDATAELEAAKKAPFSTQGNVRDTLERIPGTATDLLADTARGAARAVTGAARLSIPGQIFSDKIDQADKVLDETSKRVKDYVGSDLFKKDEAQNEKLGSKVVQGVVSTGVFAGGGAAGKALGLAPGFVTAVMGALPQGEQQFQQALKAEGLNPDYAKTWLKNTFGIDATAEQANGIVRWTMFATGLGIGASEAVPIGRMFERLEKISGGRLTQYLGVIAAQAGEEGAQEAFQAFAQNLSARLLLDPNQELTKDVAENALVGAISGAGVTSVFAAPGLARRGGVPTPETATITPEEIQRQATEPKAAGEPEETVRFFHGGKYGEDVGPTDGMPKWLTPDENYARNYKSDGTPNEVYFVDIPKSQIPPDGFDDINGRYIHFDAPPQIAGQLKRLEERKNEAQSAPEGNAPVAQNDRQSDSNRSTLRAFGYTDQQIDDMSPAQRAREVQEAVDSGIEPEKAAEEFGADDAVHGSRAAPVKAETAEDIARAAARVNTEPTEAQKEAGNYRKQHVKFNGLDITIENPKGSKRTGRAKDGTEWSVDMPGHYGYIKRSTGADGDQVDVYVGDNLDPNGPVFVVDQNGLDGKFDEHKVIMGVGSEAEARSLYEAGFSDGSGAQRFGSISQLSADEFKDWLKSGDTKKPLMTTKAVTPAAAPSSNDPLSLMQFIASKGGLAPHGDLKAMDLNSSSRVQIPGRKGFFGVVKPTGMSLDAMRRAAQEAGYFPADRPGAPPTSSVREFLNAINDEMRGNPRRAAGEEADLTKRDEERITEANAEYEARVADHRADLEQMLNDAGVPADLVNQDDLALAARIMEDEGLDPDDALERAAMRNLEDEPAVTPEEIDDIYDFGAFDAVQPQPAPTDEQAASEESGERDGPGEEVSDAEPRADVPRVVEDRQEPGEGEAPAEAEREARSSAEVSDEVDFGGEDDAAEAAPAKPRKLSKAEQAYEREREERAKKFNDEMAKLPSDAEALTKLYAATIDDLDAAIRDGDDEAAQQSGARLGYIEAKINGETRSGVATQESPAEALRNDTAAPIGTTPKWGQRGVFKMVVDDIEFIVTSHAGSGPAIYAVDENKPFPSETGYRSMLGASEGNGQTVEQFWRDQITRYIAEERGSGRKAKELRNPTAWYRLPDDYSNAGYPERVGDRWDERQAESEARSRELIEKDNKKRKKNEPLTPETASRAMETALDNIEQAIEAGADRKAVREAGKAARRVLNDMPQEIKDEDKEYWSQFEGVIRKMMRPGYVTGKQQAERDAATEQTEAGEQTVLPGAEKIGDGEFAQRKTDEKLKPSKPQKPADEGLFSDDSKQMDLLGATPEKPAKKERFKEVGKNADGQTLFEDKNGVRSRVEDGVRLTEPVTLRPTNTGMEVEVGDRDPEWEIAPTEVEQTKARESGPSDSEVSFDLDGATTEMQADDSDETVTVTLTRKGPWDFNDTYPAPDAERIAAMDREGRNPFADGFDVENIVGMVDEGLNGIMSAVAEIRAIDKRIADIRSGKAKPAKKQTPEKAIKGLRTDRERYAQEVRDTAASYEEAFGNEAANAMVAESRRRIVAEEHSSPEVKQRPAETEGFLAELFAEKLLAGEKFPTIIAARRLAKDAFGAEDVKQIEEQLELGVVKASREIIAKGEDAKAIYAALVDLYQRQPKLGTRTSTSMRDMAFSTPVPLAYVASRFAGINDMEGSVIYEPTAGNGALLIEANAAPDVGSKIVIANEINKQRADNLRTIAGLLKGIKPELQTFQVTSVDASDPAQANSIRSEYEGADHVIANPPFGAVKDVEGSKVYDLSDIQPGYKTTQIDHAIALRALSAMRDDGRATLIVGGIAKTAASEKARSDAYNGKAKREFYKTLYDRYNVTDHFTVAGELYERQGAGWPVDVIVIDGRGKSSRELPAVDVPRVYTSWDQLGELLDANRNDERTPRGQDGAVDQDDTADRPTIPDEGVRAPAGGRGVSDRVAEARDAEDVRAGSIPEQSGNVVADRASDADQVQPGERGEPGRPDSAAPAERRAPRLEQETERQVAYKARSTKTNSLGTLVPVNMRTSLQQSLDRIAERVGSIDDYVAAQLGYKADELNGYFSAEQIDALALAIDNLARNKGFIIGDQTGIGKGRVNAAIIRWAIKNNRIPVFVTEKPNLYGDMYRDLQDIGISDDFLDGPPRILATNADTNVPLTDDGKVVLRTPAAKTHNAELTSLTASNFGEKYDMVFTNYSQMQTLKGENTPRRGFLSNIINSAIVIFDESHNAGGQDQARKAKGEKADRAGFARDLVSKAAGVFYSSATYAKRPEVMDLYAATDMSMAVEKPADLGEAIAKGGVPMQQVVATMLADAGQYVRRERSFAGVKYETPLIEVDRAAYDGISKALSSILAFSDIIKGVAEKADAQLKKEASGTAFDNATGDAGAKSVAFTSIMHNIINQMLLAMKAQGATDRAVAAIKAGQKPVITLANTMESFLSKYSEDTGIVPGAVFEASFNDVLLRYLDRTRTLLVKKPFSQEVERVYVTDATLGQYGVKIYEAAKKQISAIDLTNLPVSPIDAIKDGIRKAGYTVGEITGRGTIVDYSGDQPILKPRPGKETSIRGRRETIADFNSGKLDAVILNQAGATGLSLHSSERFKDQRQRRMIIAQAEANIDTHMQMLGRVHRTGQVIVPEYDQLVADIPAEKRPAAVLAKKMASLNANTTASRGGALTAKDVPDFLNQYGDLVAAQYVAEDPTLNSRLGEPIKFKDNGTVDIDDSMRKLTGRIPLLPLEEQEQLYDHLETEYNALLKQLEASGDNALEAKTLDLKARTIERTEVLERKSDSVSPFAAPVVVEKVSSLIIGKPFSSVEVVQQVFEGRDKAYRSGSVEITPENAAKEYTNLLNTSAFFKRPEVVLQRYKEPLEAFDTYKRGILGDITDIARQTKERERLDAIKDRWTSIIKITPVGARVTFKTATGNIHGIVTNVEQKGEPKNPLALSTWKITAAISDATRQVTIPVSRLWLEGKYDEDDPFAVEVAPIQDWLEKPEATLGRFDNRQSEAREERFIATGNLLAAYDWLNMKGRIINYTDDEGHIRQGIMTSPGFDLDMFVASKPKVISAPADIVAWLQGHRGQSLWSTDQRVRISIPQNGKLIIAVDAAKKVGGVFFLDRQLTLLTGDFIKTGGTMKAETWNSYDEVVQRLQGLGAIFALNEDKTPQTVRASVGKPERRRNPIPSDAPSITSYTKDEGIKSNANYAAAKAGDAQAAIRLVQQTVKPGTTEQARRAFGDAVYVPVIAQERTGPNAIPATLAAYYASKAGGTVERGIHQDNKAFHTGAGPMERIGNRARFAGQVQEGARYVLVDDVSVMGSTLAELADYIQSNGGEVAGVVTLVNASRSGTLSPKQAQIREIERRFGDAVREAFDIDPSALTADEATYLLNFRDADALRARVAAARGERDDRLRAKGIPRELSSVRARLGELTPQAVKRRANLETALELVIRKIAGPSVNVRFADRIELDSPPEGWGSFRPDAQTAAGTYVPAEFLVTVALADPKYPLSQSLDTSFHESFHAVEDRLLTDAEMEVLRREGDRLRQIVKQAYGYTEDEIASIAGYEIRAMAFEYYASKRARGEAPQGFHIAIRRAFERLLQLFREIRNALAGLGFTSADQIFKNAYEGKFAERSSERRLTDIAANIRPRGDLNRFESFDPLPERWQDWWKKPDLRWGDRVWGMIDAAFLPTNRALGDKYGDMRRMQAAVELTGKNVTENVDMALAATLFEGRTEKRLKDYWLKLWKPVLDEAAAKGLTRANLHYYLYARHAKERNRAIAAINDAMPDGGSGMTDEEADTIIEEARTLGILADLESVAQGIDRIVRTIRADMVNDQLEHEETIGQWEQKFSYYVPLQGFEAGEETIAGSNRSGGFDVRGPETKRALGRYSKADDVLSNLFLMGERTIIRGEQARVGRAAMRFMQSNPQPSIYEVKRSERVYVKGKPETMTEQDLDLLQGEHPVTVTRVDPRTGMVEVVTKVASPFAQNSFAVKVGGHTYYISIKHQGFLTALKNVGVQRLPWLVQAHAWLTRQFAAFRTARNPDWFVANMSRDIQDAAYTLTANERDQLLKHFAGNIASLRTYVGAVMGELMEGKGKIGEIARAKFADKRLAALYEDWKEHGGQIAFMGIHDIESAKKEIEAAFNETNEGYLKRALMAGPRGARGLLKGIEFFNAVIEAGTRLAVYDAGLKAGMTKAKAAQLSKEATTNFNRKGIYSPFLNSFYAFFNARVQGTAKMVRLLREKGTAGKWARRGAIGLVLGGFGSTLWNITASPEDEEKKKKYARRQYHEREAYFHFYWPGSSEPLKLPMAHIFRPFWMLGENLAMLSQGQITPAQAAANYLSTIVGAFSPISSEGSPTDPGTWLRTIMPSVEMPLLELTTNENWRRKPIHPKYEKKGEPHSQQYFSTNSPFAIDVAQFLNRITGGDAFRPGKVDVYPGDVQYLMEFATGGLGQTVNRTDNMLRNWANGVPTPTNQIPILRHFVGRDVQQSASDAYYEDRDKIQKSMARVRKAMKSDAMGPNAEDAVKTIEEGQQKLGVRDGKRKGTVTSTAETIIREADGKLKALRAEESTVRADPNKSRAERNTAVEGIRTRMRDVQNDARRRIRELSPVAP